MMSGEGCSGGCAVPEKQTGVRTVIYIRGKRGCLTVSSREEGMEVVSQKGRLMIVTTRADAS